MSAIFSSSYFSAFASVAVALVATLLFSPLLGEADSPFFLIAVMFSAWRGGILGGGLATILSLIVDIFLRSPSFTFEVQRHELSQIAVDVIASAMIGTLSVAVRRAEKEREQLLELEKTARLDAERASSVKDEIVAVVSHELRTPLTTIKTLTHILRFKDPTPEEKDEYLADIAAECNRQIDLVHNLLDLSRIQQGGIELEVKAVNVEKVVRECVKLERIEAAAHQHKIKIEATPYLAPVSADESGLRRSICTMIENSIKYTPDGGVITVRATARADDRIAIEISDNGRGIHPQDMPHIFDRFFRGHLLPTEGTYTYADDQEVKGIGLGLHLAKILIEGMKGEILVRSDVGWGSSFTIVLNKWDGTTL